MRIEPFDPRNAGEREYRAAAAFHDLIRAELQPGDPPIPLEERVAGWRNLPTFTRIWAWHAAAEEGERIVASGTVSFLDKEENRHAASFDIAVLPEFRRRGLARDLLRRIVDVAQRERRTLLMTFTLETAPAGEAFLRRLGGEPGLVGHVNQLDLRELRPELLQRWVDRAAERAGDFDLVVWEQDVPEEHLEDVAAMFEAINRAPRGALRVEDEHWTAAHFREFQRLDRARGNQPWMIVARHRPSGRLAGWTDVAWNPSRPEILQQRGTAVFPEFQRRGLGRWLKAAMLQKVLAERPEVRYVRTGNADMNAPMLKINEELGFKPFRSSIWWQVELEKVLAYLRDGAA